MSTEQEELAQVLDRVCRLEDPSARRAAADNVGLFDADGLAPDDEAVAFRILGRHLAPITWLATALAAPLWPGGTSASPGGVALAEHHGSGTWRVLGDRRTDAVLAVGLEDARLLGGLTLDDPTPGFDPGTDIAVVPEAVLTKPEPITIVPRGPILRRGSLLVAALLAGSAEASLHRSVVHVKQREQFGRPIGAFQAVAHRCADMAVRAEAATAAVHLAAAAVASSTEDADATVAAARLVSADAALRNAAEDIQHHGALGFAAEVACHRHLKRAHLLERTLGAPGDQVDALLSVGSAARTRPG